MTVRCIEKEFDLTVGKEYKVLSLESQGDYYLIVDDSGNKTEHDSSCFSLVHKQEDLRVKCLKALIVDLSVGKEYELIAVEDFNGKEAYRVLDDSGEDYLYNAAAFEIIKSA